MISAANHRTIIQSVIQTFSVIPEVEAIYQDNLHGWLRFWVFTNNLRYDDALMDKLIAGLEEIDAENVADIRFPPSVLCGDHREVVGNNAVLIWKT